MVKKPTVQEIEEYLNSSNICDLRGATVKLVAEKNHLIYRLDKGEKIYALRMINPESYRAREWISVEEEYAILKIIGPTGLGPKVFFRDTYFSPSFVIQEFIEATCFNKLKPLSEEHLRVTAEAIALLNVLNITPEKLPFLKKYIERSYHGRSFAWYSRLLDSFMRLRNKDVWGWILKIRPIIKKTTRILSRFECLLPRVTYTFHFDGAHCGNTYWRNGKVIFLDWQKVSYRNDPTFTLVRFATSVGEKGKVSQYVMDTLINAYLGVCYTLYFEKLAWARLLERQVSDLIWVIWDYARRGDQRPLEEATSVEYRYEEVKELIRRF